jgi:ADP-ribosyl-[dinitrogen reductase] hydrolase
MSEVSLLDRYRGAMVGVHVGDALGARFEGKGPKKVAELLAADGGLQPCAYQSPWDKDAKDPLPAGMPTDDSDQTAVLAHSLIECNGLNVEHLRKALQENVIGGKSLLWTGRSTGSGQTTQKALSDDPAEIAEAMNNNIGTNGSLMRSVPMALWMHGELYSARIFNSATKTFHHPDNIISDMSAVTHNHWHSKMSCVIYCYALSYVLEHGNDENFNHAKMHIQLHHRFEPLPLFMRVYNSLNDEYLFPIDPGAWPARGTAEFSLYAALWCFKNSTSFADGIEKAIRVGGDTDTVAAVAGGLLGAYYGYEAIPFEWRNTILGKLPMLEYADKLYEMNQQL